MVLTTGDIEQWRLEDKISVAGTILDSVVTQMVVTSYARKSELEHLCDLRKRAWNISSNAIGVFNLLDEEHQYRLEKEEK